MSLASEFSKWRDFKGMACQLPRFASSQNSFPASSWIIEGLSRGPTNSSGTPRLPEVVEQWESWTSHVLMHPKCCLYTLLAQAAMLTAQEGRLRQAQSGSQPVSFTMLRCFYILLELFYRVTGGCCAAAVEIGPNQYTRSDSMQWHSWQQKQIYSRVRNKHTGTLINFWGFF